MKVIAIQDGLETLKQELQNSGYEVIPFDQIDSPVDAYIYSEHDNNSSLVTVNQHLNNVFSSAAPNIPSNTGTLLINAKGKTVDEIKQILTNKTYSPLF